MKTLSVTSTKLTVNYSSVAKLTNANEKSQKFWGTTDTNPPTTFTTLM